jgi:hypothetical protein
MALGSDNSFETRKASNGASPHIQKMVQTKLYLVLKDEQV